MQMWKIIHHYYCLVSVYYLRVLQNYSFLSSNFLLLFRADNLLQEHASR